MGTTRRLFLTRQLPMAGAAVLAAPAWASGNRSDQPATEVFLDAVARGDLSLVESLLDRDRGLVFTRDKGGRSAVAVALLARHRPVADLIRSHGYQLDVHEAALAHDWERFDALAEEAPGSVDREHPIGGTAMYAAAIGGAGTDLWHVYAAGGDPNRSAPEAYSPLRAAFEYPDLATAELTAAALLSNDADPNAPQPGASSPLHAAAARGSLDLVEMLIRLGADVGARDAEGRSAEDLARVAGHRASAEMVRRHAEIPRRHSTSRAAYDVDGNPYEAPDLSAFSEWTRERLVGFSHRDLEQVRHHVERHPLLAHSISTTSERAVEASAHAGRKPLVEYLLEHGAPYSLPTAVMRGDTDRVRELLEEDPRRIHERGAHDFPLLWYPTIGGGLVDMAERLLRAGAEVERQHFLGTTALHWACVSGDRDLATLLMDHGADPNRLGRKFDPRGHTPLMLAEARGHSDVVALLRERGAKG